MDITRIYLVTNCYDDPFKVYIGKTKNNRKRDHKLRFGNNIIYSYIDEVCSLKHEDWKPLESFWINYFKMLGFDIQNRNNGGGGPDRHSVVTKKVISKMRKGKGLQSVLQYDLNGEFIKVWDSVNDVLNYFNINQMNIHKACRTPNYQSRGFMWRLYEENFPKNIEPYITPVRDDVSREKTSLLLRGIKRSNEFKQKISKSRKGIKHNFGDRISKSIKGKNRFNGVTPVIQKDKLGNIIKEFPSIAIAAKDTKSNSSTISKVCRGKLKSTNGYCWEFKQVDSKTKTCSKCLLLKKVDEFINNKKSWCRDCVKEYNKKYYS
jgi:hypothetical protein